MEFFIKIHNNIGVLDTLAKPDLAETAPQDKLKEFKSEPKMASGQNTLIQLADYQHLKINPARPLNSEFKMKPENC